MEFYKKSNRFISASKNTLPNPHFVGISPAIHKNVQGLRDIACDVPKNFCVCLLYGAKTAFSALDRRYFCRYSSTFASIYALLCTQRQGCCGL